MTVWQYVCVSCGEIHDAPLRPEGAVFLRCVATREWAWHQPTSFRAAPAPVVAPPMGRGLHTGEQPGALGKRDDRSDSSRAY